MENSLALAADRPLASVATRDIAAVLTRRGASEGVARDMIEMNLRREILRPGRAVRNA